MPTGTRHRFNGIFGTVTDNPLTAGAGTFNSLGLTDMGVVSAPDHAIVTLDPLKQFGDPEIVIITSHTAAATVASITRGQYGTIARDHPQGTLWVHAPLDEDFIEIVTAATRPSNPYEGQFIFETDTNKLVGYGGVDWAPRDAGGSLGYAETTTTQSTITDADVTSLTATVTVGTGRRIRVSWHEPAIVGSAASDLYSFRLQEGATILQDDVVGVAASNIFNRAMNPSIVLTPSAGSHTYKAHITRTSGTGSISLNRSATQVAYFLVEDIGAA